MEDNQIIDLYFERDEEAIAQSNLKYGRYCYSIAYHILNDNFQSEESVEDTWISSWNAIPPTRPNILSSFFGKITRNHALNRLRDENTFKRGNGTVNVVYEELENVLSNNATQDAVNEHVLIDCINAFLKNEKKENRIIFVRRYFYFDTIEEIANQMAFTESRVKMSLKRTKDRLRSYLLKEGLL